MENKKKNLTLSEEIRPLERDEMGHLLGGFADVCAVSEFDDRVKNKTGECGNGNCSETKNKGESCDNTNCICKCKPNSAEYVTILP